MTDGAPYRTSPPASPLGRLASQGAVYLAASLVARALSVVMVPVYTRRLGPADYGALELIDTLDLVVIAAFSTPIADPVLRHFHDAPEGRSRDAVVSTAVLSLAAAGALVAAAGLALSPALASLILHDRGRADLFAFTFLSVTFQAVMEVPFAVLRGTGRAWSAGAWGVARTALGLALNVALLVGLSMGVRGVVLSNLVASAAVCTLLTGATLRRTGLAFDRAALRRMLAFGWPLLPGALAMIALGHSRSYVLNAYAPMAEVGVWSLGWRIGGLISQVLGHPLRAAWTAGMYGLWDSPDGRGPAHYRRAGTWMVALFAWAAAALTALAPELVRVVGGAGFARAVAVVPAAAAAFALREVAEYFRNGLLVGRDARAVAWLEPALALFDLALGVALVSRLGLRGAILAAPVVYGVYAVAMHRAARRALPVRYEYGRMAALAALGVALGAAGFFLRTGHAALDVAAKLALVGLYPAAALGLVLRDPEERAAVTSLWNRARLFYRSGPR